MSLSIHSVVTREVGFVPLGHRMILPGHHNATPGRWAVAAQVGTYKCPPSAQVPTHREARGRPKQHASTQHARVTCVNNVPVASAGSGTAQYPAAWPMRRGSAAPRSVPSSSMRTAWQLPSSSCHGETGVRPIPRRCTSAMISSPIVTSTMGR